MKYVGGKGTIAKDIVGYITNIRDNGQSYWEPFMGGAHILSRINIRDANVYGSDAHQYLMSMWIALQGGWQPPSNPTHKQHKLAQRQVSKGEDNGFSDAELGYYGFALSFRGKWFSGYAESVSDPMNLAGQVRYTEAKSGRIGHVKLFVADFLSTDPPEDNMIIYCDPPYEGTYEYRGVPKFDHPAFWTRVRLLEERGHTVLVSEYKAPEGFACVMEVETLRRFNNVGRKNDTIEKRVERLFRWGDHKPPQLTLL